MPSIPNQQGWRKALARFASVGFSSFRSFPDQVVGMVQLARELPDRERTQFSLSCGSTMVTVFDGNTRIPTCGISSAVDIRIERIHVCHVLSAQGPFSRFGLFVFNPIAVGLAFGSTAWNPFDFASGIFQPQFRPNLQNGILQPGSTVGIEGTATAPPPALSLAHKVMPAGTRVNASEYYAQSMPIEFGPDGLIVPAGLILAVAPDNSLNNANGLSHTLWASFTYRELDP